MNKYNINRWILKIVILLFCIYNLCTYTKLRASNLEFTNICLLYNIANIRNGPDKPAKNPIIINIAHIKIINIKRASLKFVKRLHK